MSDVVEEIRCALAMRDVGYAVIFDHVTSAELLRRYDIAVTALEEIASGKAPAALAQGIASEALRDVVSSPSGSGK